MNILNRIFVVPTVAAIVLSLSQCAKDNTKGLDAFSSEYEIVDVTFNASGFSGKTKVAVSEVGDLLNFVWEESDLIYVYDGTKYCGSLSLEKGADTKSGTFSGVLSVTASATELVFYYFGSNITKPTSKAAAVSMNYHDQDGDLNYVKKNLIATCTLPYSSGQTTFGGSMSVPFSVGKFSFSSSDYTDGQTIHVEGVAEGISIANTGVLSYVEPDEGCCSHLTYDHSVSSYYIVLPSDGYGNSLNFYNIDGSKIKIFPKQLENGIYYTSSGGAIPVTLGTRSMQPMYKDGVIGRTISGSTTNDAEFSISATEKVNFSTGNLWFRAGDGTVSDPKWAFAEMQYHFLGDGVIYGSLSESGNLTAVEEGREYQSKWIDLYAWGASGQSDGNTGGGNTVNPTYCAFVSSDIHPKLIAKGAVLGTADWANLPNISSIGIYTDPTLTQKVSGTWKTLKKSEWEYLASRSYTVGTNTYYKTYQCSINYGTPCNVNKRVYGLLCLADSDNVNGSKNPTARNRNYISRIPDNALFFPEAQIRYSRQIRETDQHRGEYWGSDATGWSSGEDENKKTYANIFGFGLTKDGTFIRTSTTGRAYGLAVRLAKVPSSVQPGATLPDDMSNVSGSW